MKMIEYLYLGLLIGSVVLIYFALEQYTKSKNLLNYGIKTKAKVVDLIEDWDSDGTNYKPVFEFTDKYGSEIRFENEVSSNPVPYKIGDIVDVVYSMNSEERKVVSFWGLYRWTILLLCFASSFMIVGGGYFLYSK